MSTKTETRPYTSGFCCPSNPPSSHARCERYVLRPCACPCHVVAEPVVAEDPLAALRRCMATSPPTPVPHQDAATGAEA